MQDRRRVRAPIPVVIALVACAFLALLAGAPGGKASASPEVPQSRAQLALSYAPVVKRAAPAVVNIYTRKLVAQRALAPLFEDPLFRHFFGGNGLPQGLTRQRVENALGSGVLIRSDGLIVTCNHVVEGADEITVVLADRREFEATLVTADPKTDLALLRVEGRGESFPALSLRDSDEVEVGDLVLAIGNPFGVGQTVTSGIVSALARTSLDINDLNYFIQTDAAINPGNSGGALVTMDGRLVGVNSAIYSRSGGSMGLGFAVPANMVRTVMDAVEKGRRSVVRPWLGVEGQTVTADIAASLKLARPGGVLVNRLHPASPARAAGLRVGDVIQTVGGREVEDLAAFRYRIATLAPGAVAELGVRRGGESLPLRAKLIAPPEDPPRQETEVRGRNPLAGATLVNLSPAMAEELGLSDQEKGVVIVKVEPQTNAADIGLKPGDKILAVNGRAIANVTEALESARQSPRAWRLSIGRDGNILTLLVGG